MANLLLSEAGRLVEYCFVEITGCRPYKATPPSSSNGTFVCVKTFNAKGLSKYSEFTQFHIAVLGLVSWRMDHPLLQIVPASMLTKEAIGWHNPLILCASITLVWGEGTLVWRHLLI